MIECVTIATVAIGAALIAIVACVRRLRRDEAARADLAEALNMLRLVNLEFQRRPECFDIFPLKLIQDVRAYVDRRSPPLPPGMLG